jgi:glycerol-3-phosphate dehydrogenase
MVIDTQSLMDVLRKPHADKIFTIDWTQSQLQKNNDDAVIVIQTGSNAIKINSQLIVFAAGKGNGELLQQLNVKKPAMQLRPLQQVMVRHRHHHALYAHCVGTDSKPRLTISSHRDGEYTVWYLGGQLAEDGVSLSSGVLIQRAKKELQTLFSWLDWTDAEWATLPVERAEPAQPGMLRPDNAWLSACDNLSNCVAAWPTKLTLVPNLGNLLIEYLAQQKIVPMNKDKIPAVLLQMKTIAPTPWQHVNWQNL